MRIAFYSNSPHIGTGYGTQTAQLTKRMRGDGHDVAVISNYGTVGGVFEWDGMPVYPMGADAWSNDTIVAHTMDWAQRGPVVLFTLFDVWPLRNEQLDRIPQIVSWVPIDHAPAPPEVLRWCSRPNVLPVAMAEFGREMLGLAGVEHRYAPHGIDTTDTFTPDADGDGFRKHHGIPADAHLVCLNFANKGNGAWHRKAPAEMFMALGEHMQSHRDTWVYLHTMTDRGHGGWDLERLMARFGIPRDRVKVVDQYRYRTGIIPQEHLAAAYAASDVLLSTSLGEGFGLAAIEAQACGTRVIVTDATAQPELVGDGWKVEAQPWWDEAMDACLFTPSVPGIIRALGESHKLRGRSDMARKHAEQWDADLVYARDWRPILAEVEQRLDVLEPVP